MFSLQVRRARVIKYKPRGICWPPAQGGSEVRRHLWEQLKLALSVNDSSHSRLASRRVCYRLPRHLLLQIVICIIKYHRLKAPPTCELVLTMLTISLASYHRSPQIILSWSYCSVDYGKRTWRLFGTVFKQMRPQRRAVPGCFGFTGAKGCCGAGSSTGFGKSLIYVICSRICRRETQTKRKERGISSIAITKY